MALRRLTSFKLSGHVPMVMVCETEEDLARLPEDYQPIGAGSNLLISPLFERPLIKISPDFLPISYDSGELSMSAGMPVSMALNWMADNGYSGLEFAAGVPATIGGMVAMNFECWGQEMSSILCRVLVYSHASGLQWLDRSDVLFGYRTSSFHNSDWLICGVVINPTNDDSRAIKQRMSDYIQKRKQKQPIFHHTFGSVFMNPKNHKVGQLVESLGLKGLCVGGARISNHHANFFENTHAATFEDAIELIQRIKKAVYNRYKVQLSCEVKILS